MSHAFWATDTHASPLMDSGLRNTRLKQVSPRALCSSLYFTSSTMLTWLTRGTKRQKLCDHLAWDNSTEKIRKTLVRTALEKAQRWPDSISVFAADKFQLTHFTRSHKLINTSTSICIAWEGLVTWPKATCKYLGRAMDIDHSNMLEDVMGSSCSLGSYDKILCMLNVKEPVFFNTSIWVLSKHCARPTWERHKLGESRRLHYLKKYSVLSRVQSPGLTASLSTKVPSINARHKAIRVVRVPSVFCRATFWQT